jgi:hypothetical protein
MTGMDSMIPGSLGLSLGMMSWKTWVPSMGPGATTLAVMSCGPSSSAQVRASPTAFKDLNAAEIETLNGLLLRVFDNL